MNFNRVGLSIECSLFSLIHLSSANVSLPSPVTSGAAAGIHFRELFDFEVNFSESK